METREGLGPGRAGEARGLGPGGLWKPMAGAVIVLAAGVACDGDEPTGAQNHDSHPPAAIQLSATRLALEIGQQASVTARALCEHGVEISPTISWASGDQAVASVDGTGKVTAVAFGGTTVTASSGVASGQVAVDVAAEGTVVGAQGGVVRSADGLLTLEIPAGALEGPTDIVVERLDDADFSNDPLYVMGTAFEIRPASLELQVRARLRIRFQEHEVPAGVPFERLRIQERERQQERWRETEENQLRVQDREVEARIEGFGVFGIVPSHAAMIGPAGGTVTSADGRARLEVPAGALSQVQEIALHRVGDAAFQGDANYVRGTRTISLPTVSSSRNGPGFGSSTRRRTCRPA